MIDKLVADIDIALENGAFLAALTVALILPDACGKAAYPELNVGERYKTWYRENVIDTRCKDEIYKHAMPYLSDELVYSLRCSFLHQSSSDINRNQIKQQQCKVDGFKLFIADEGNDRTGGSLVIDKNFKIVQRDLDVDIRYLCYILKTAAQEYYSLNKEKFDFIKCNIVDIRKSNR